MMDTLDGSRRRKVPLTLHPAPPCFIIGTSHFISTPQSIIITRHFRLPLLGWGVSWVNSAPFLLNLHYKPRICYTTRDKACTQFLLHYSCRRLRSIILQPLAAERSERWPRRGVCRPVPVSHPVPDRVEKKKQTARSAPKARAPRCGGSPRSEQWSGRALTKVNIIGGPFP